MKTLIIDIETDNLLMQATQIFVACIRDADTGKETTFLSPDGLQDIIDRYDRIVGHNIIMFDAQVLRRLWGIHILDEKLYDTLIVSRILEPDREGGHSLKAWGKRIGNYKDQFADFTKLSDEMITYCQQDVRVTNLLYKRLLDDCSIYSRIDMAITIERDFALVMAKMVQSGVRVDLDALHRLHHDLVAEATPLYEEIKAIMPKVRDNTAYKKIKEEGRILSETTTSFTYIQAKTRKVVTKEFKFEEPNPTSRTQLIKWFMSKGWRPTELTDKGNPEINETILDGMGIPEAKKVAKLFRIQKSIGQVHDGDNSLIKCYNHSTGRIHGDINTLGANTSRCTHSKPNLSQVSKKDQRIREAFIAPEGRVLVDTDMAGIELRILGHYLHPYDSGSFAFEVTQGDIHTYNKNLMGLDERSSAKTAIFALVYGAGNAKLGITYAKDQKDFTRDEDKLRHYGTQLRKNVENNFIGYKELVSDVQRVAKSRGYLIGIDGRPLHARKEYSALNLLIQSSGAILSKLWTIKFHQAMNEIAEYGRDWEIHLHVHDEILLSCKPELANKALELSNQSLIECGKHFKMKVDLKAEGKFGKDWWEIH